MFLELFCLYSVNVCFFCVYSVNVFQFRCRYVFYVGCHTSKTEHTVTCDYIISTFLRCTRRHSWPGESMKRLCGVPRPWTIICFVGSISTISIVAYVSLLNGCKTLTCPPTLPFLRHYLDNSSSTTLAGVGQAGEAMEKKASKGFIFALDFYDQMTGSCMNLLTLQCWASEFDLSVPEPFIARSMFGTSIKTGQEGQRENAARLSDVFDIDFWQNYTERMNYSHLVSWEDFLSSAPRKLIIAAQLTTGECETVPKEFKEMVLPFADEYNFAIVREVCFNFVKTGSVEKSKFKEDLYGEHPPNEVTVLFNRWGGINGYSGENRLRISLLDHTCQRDYKYVRDAPRKSASISNDVQKYVDTYLNGSSTYIAVMIRFEYYFIRHKLVSKSDEEQISMVDECIQSVISQWKELSAQHSLQNTLLTMDFGKLGTGSVEGSPWCDTSWMEEKVRGLFSGIYASSSLSLEQWEESFESVASKKAPGYIAVLQRELAARAQCLMVAGSRGLSAFHGEAKRLYHEYHSGSAKCVGNGACS